jgi:hypothetical protein
MNGPITSKIVQIVADIINQPIARSINVALEAN